MVVFGLIAKKRDHGFEKWLTENGYFYMKTTDNRPCFKSKLTQNLKKQFKIEKDELKKKK